ncbi:MAG: pyridoxamine 5'-phosphate oxidase family protein [Rubrivivax sp.]|nr:pyridoxamine 5'-phosphate oxidase family protein [Rubrivivax sp.]
MAHEERTSPFHAGEQALQARVGVREHIEALGRQIVRDHMPAQHRELFGKLPTLLLGAVDAEGQPWATVLHGPPGFVSTPDARTLRIATWPAADDPLAPLLRTGAPVGVLGLEAHTRRRNRANGTVGTVGEAGREGFDVQVAQSFGNCPKYIQAREPRPQPRTPGAAQDTGARLDDAALALVRGADTLFIASASARAPAGAAGEGVDVSHRGGRPGFVQVAQSSTGHVLTLPDYAGNQLFNTLGNLVAWPFAGLLFVDHAGGDLLHVAVRAELQHAGPELAAHAGALRLLHLHVLRSRRRPAALPLAWTTAQPAPQFAPRQGGLNPA